MALFCPFCNATESCRVEGEDEKGNGVVLLMFDCPFYFRFPRDELASDEVMQKTLQVWKEEHGESWLESVGPIMRKRELANIKKSQGAFME